MQLYTKILIGLIAGAVVGIGVNLLGIDAGLQAIGYIEPVGLAWIRAIKMIVVPLVVASLVVGAASLGDLRTLGRVGGKTLAFYMSTTAVAVMIGLTVSNILRPGQNLAPETREQLLAEYGGDAAANINLAQEAPGVVDVFMNMIPENPIRAAADGQMLQLILFSILFGVATSLIVQEERRRAVMNVFEGINDVAMTLIGWIMIFAPFAVFALIASITARFGVGVLKSLAFYTVTVVLGLLLHGLGTYTLLLKFLAKTNPIPFLKKIRPVQLLGFSTSSSSATLPLTMQTAEHTLGISNRTASFVLPLGATINMDGTALYQGVAVMFIAQVFGIDLSIGQQLMVVLTATLASVGAAGVPGAGIITLTLVLTQAGVPETGIALILGVDRLLDMLRTSVNLTGDMTAAAFVARSEGEDFEAQAVANEVASRESPALATS